MPTIKIHFREMIQDSQDYGSNDEHMVSRAFFDLVDVSGHTHQNLYIGIKQAVGSSFETNPLEVLGPLVGYKGPFNWQEFRNAVEGYCRSFVGQQGQGIRLGEGTTQVRMHNNRFIKPMTVEFEVDVSKSGSW